MASFIFPSCHLNISTGARSRLRTPDWKKMSGGQTSADLIFVLTCLSFWAKVSHTRRRRTIQARLFANFYIRTKSGSRLAVDQSGGLGRASEPRFLSLRCFRHSCTYGFGGCQECHRSQSQQPQAVKTSDNFNLHRPKAIRGEISADYSAAVLSFHRPTPCCGQPTDQAVKQTEADRLILRSHQVLRSSMDSSRLLRTRDRDPIVERGTASRATTSSSTAISTL